MALLTNQSEHSIQTIVPFASVSKRLLVRNLSYENEFYSQVHFHFIETEAKGKKMAYWSIRLTSKVLEWAPGVHPALPMYKALYDGRVRSPRDED